MVTQIQRRNNPFSPPGPDWIGSEPEWYAFQALTSLRVDFTFQSQLMGGRTVLGGAIVDFIIPNLNLVIGIQGTYWHYSSAGRIASDKAQRIAIESTGTRVIWIQEEDITRNPIFYIREALQYREHTPDFI